MTTIIKAVLGLSAAALICCIPEWVAPHMSPGCTWLLMAALPAGLVVYVWHWSRKAAEQEEGEKE